jgi:predicted metalloprotease with PDZ domain
MKYWLSIIISGWLPFMLVAQNQYVYHADLQNIDHDKISVELEPPAIVQSTIVFSFPRIIPGSYSEKNFGSYIDDFTATSKSGRKLVTKKLNPNQYEIQDAGNILQISYKVNDTWDKPSKDFIFQPGGTNIEAGKNVVMNNHGFFGYFEGYQDLPVKVVITKPAEMYGASNLPIERTNATTDTWNASNYFFLIDNPVFYSVPDTTSFKAGNSTINIAVISANNIVNSKQVANYLKPLATALNQFFDGLPVNSYQFLFYFEKPSDIIGKQNAGGFGALEHNYSSLYFLPEIGYEAKMKALILEVASHEFLHILTPLNLHSEEIENFDFIHPKMSKHLWLYEGVTEYFAQLTQLQNGLITHEAFFENMREKINASQKFGNFSLTEMSEQVLEPAYKDKYNSVYNKGALTAMMLDLFIRQKSNGTKDLKSVIQGLAAKYGPGKPFKDDQLFDELVTESHPDVKFFITDYIEGVKPLPYNDMFRMIGYEFSETKKIDAYYNGRLALKYDEKSHEFIFTDVEKRNALDINNDDVLIAVNNTAITDDNAEALWEKFFKRNTIYPELTVTVKREGVEKTLSAVLFKGYLESKNYLAPDDEADEAQLRLRNEWMND